MDGSCRPETRRSDVDRQVVPNDRITDDELVITPDDETEGWRVTYERVAA